MKKKILFIIIIPLMVSCLSKFNKQLKMIRGGYKLVGYTVNDIDSSSSLNPLMDSISYTFLPDKPNKYGGDEYESLISYSAPPIGSGTFHCLFKETGKDSLRIQCEDDEDFYNKALSIGPFIRSSYYVSEIINVDEKNLIVRGFYKGKVYQYNLNKTSK